MSSFKNFFKNYKGSRFERFSWKLDDLIHELNEDYIKFPIEKIVEKFKKENEFDERALSKLYSRLLYCKKDQDVIFLDFFDNVAKNEKEFLIKRGSRFKILNKKQINENEYEVEMELL